MGFKSFPAQHSPFFWQKHPKYPQGAPPASQCGPGGDGLIPQHREGACDRGSANQLLPSLWQ